MKKLKNILLILFFAFMVIDPSLSYAATQQDYASQAADLKNNDPGCISAEETQEKWNDQCYTCVVIAQLIHTFMNAGAILYDYMAIAGVKILVFGFIIWAPIWGIKHLASMAGANGGQMIAELSVMLFKIGCAYIAIYMGIAYLVGFFINPILSAGADYANTVIEKSAPLGGQITLDVTEKIVDNPNDPSVIPAATLNDILLVAKSASNQISTFMVIGDVVTCYAFENPIFTVPIVNFEIPNFVQILVGLVISVLGFLMSFAVCFYLLDLAFKLGFAVLLLPIAIGLWPFPLKDAKNKVGVCIGIAINAAGTFVLIAITVSLAMVMLDNAFQTPETSSAQGGIEALFEKIKDDDKEYISNIFDLAEPYLYILLFCLIAGFKIVGKSDDYADRLFEAKGGNIKAMHHATTGAVGKISKKAMNATRAVGNVIAHQSGKAVMKAGNAVAKGINQRFITPVRSGASQGFSKGFKKDFTATKNAFNDPAKKANRGAFNNFARNVAGTTAGVISGTVGAAKGSVKGAGKAFLQNEAKNWSNMGARMAVAGKETFQSGKKAASSFAAVGQSFKGNASKKDKLFNAFKHATKATVYTAQTGLGAVKTVASTSKTTANILDTTASTLQGNFKKLTAADGKKRNLLKERSVTLEQTAQSTVQRGKDKGGVAGGFIVAKGRLQQGSSYLGQAAGEITGKIGDAATFKKDDIDKPVLKRLENEVKRYEQELEKAKRSSANQQAIADAEAKKNAAEKKLQKRQKMERGEIDV